MISKWQRFCIFLLTMGILASLWHPTFVNAAWQQPPHQFPDFGSGNGPPVASDAFGHAFALPSNAPNGTIGASLFSSGIWSDPPQTIGLGSFDSIDVAMDNGGTALGIWHDVGANEIKTASFNGISWSTPNPNPLATTIGGVEVAVSMNGPNQGVAMWIDDTTRLVRSSFFFAGNWSLVNNLGTGDFDPSIAYSANNTAVAGWFDIVLGTTVNNFTGGLWQGPIVLDPAGGSPVVGIDSSGKALAVWTNSSGNVVFSVFNGTSWSITQGIAATTGNDTLSLVMTPGGTAVATWIGSSLGGFSSSYNGFFWSAPIQITGGPIGTGFNKFLSLSVSDNGNALAVWTITASPLEIRSSRLALGGTAWTPQEFVASVSRDITFLDSSLSENGIGFASWALVEIPEQFATASIPPPGPSNMQGIACKNRFAMQTECVNTITWTPSRDPAVVAYYLRRNGILIAVIPAQGPYIYVDHDRCKVVDTYTLTAVYPGGEESLPVSITL